MSPSKISSRKAWLSGLEKKASIDVRSPCSNSKARVGYSENGALYVQSSKSMIAKCFPSYKILSPDKSAWTKQRGYFDRHLSRSGHIEEGRVLAKSRFTIISLKILIVLSNSPPNRPNSNGVQVFTNCVAGGISNFSRIK